jgi:peptidoglycan/LPS O-acetylase OafA/YrhL
VTTGFSPDPARRLDAVDGLRAVAMTMVIAQHSGLLPFGWTGVWLFYVISGFVITRGFLAEAGAFASRRSQIAAFMTRRLFRIVPAYAVYVVLVMAALSFTDIESITAELPYLLTFTFNWRMIFGDGSFSGIGHLWTISVEEQFYILFPLLFLWVSRDRFVRIALVVVALTPVVRYGFGLLLSAAGADPGAIAFAIYASSFGQFDSFLAGAMLAIAGSRIRRDPVIAHRLFAAAIAALAVYCLTFVAVNVVLRGATGVDALRNVISGILYGEGREAVVYTVMAMVAAAAIAAVLVPGRPATVLSIPALAFVGRLSYGGYLYHALVLLLLGLALGGPVSSMPVPVRIGAFLVTLALSVLAAWLSALLFERRMIRLGRTLSDRIRDRDRTRAGWPPRSVAGGSGASAGATEA